EQAGNISSQRGHVDRSRQHPAAEWLHGRPKVRPANGAAATASFQGEAVQLESGESAGSIAEGQVVGDLWRPATQLTGRKDRSLQSKSEGRVRAVYERPRSCPTGTFAAVPDGCCAAIRLANPT